MPSPFANTLYDPDAASCPAVACHLDFVEYEAEVPVHAHRKGQLIIVLYGAVSCRAENNLWIVPPRCAYGSRAVFRTVCPPPERAPQLSVY